MKIFTIISGFLVILMTLLWIPPNSEAFRECNDQDEKRWIKIRDELPKADYISIKILIDDLKKLKDQCDPKTRFHTSIVRLFINATFRQDELDGNLGRIRRYSIGLLSSPNLRR